MFVCLCVVCVSPSVLHRSASLFFFFDFSDFRFSVTFCLLYDSRLYSFFRFDCLIDSSTVDALMLVFSFPKEEFYYTYSFFLFFNFQIWSSALFYAFHKCTFGYAIDVCSVVCVV